MKKIEPIYYKGNQNIAQFQMFDRIEALEDKINELVESVNQINGRHEAVDDSQPFQHKLQQTNEKK